MQPNKEAVTENILKLAEDIYNVFMPVMQAEWLSSDITVSQLRLLLFLHGAGPSRMSTIAAGLNIAMPTATGTVDNLVKKGMVDREDDPQDRRLVICKLSDAGQEYVNKLWMSGHFEMERLLDGLSLEQLEKAEEVARILYENISKNTQKVNGDQVR